ncbi:helix-turn-helix domain-containing protein [Listeria sp. FSL L7-1485]|uniref:Helix-turn-helix domain-containing protein n=1 Tax=Listeria immobilis TaxID=2713502 RepID=A0A7X0X8Q2_9LIST|nr:helix-turn-helix domain-containing protein [Listeria immobilis]MBC1489638.1 helix-turn-helix domain-containing protein [Listeria immobilis]MBC1536613.1 helix-turn-helix domain-containing protein [Listeria immobilis]
MGEVKQLPFHLTLMKVNYVPPQISNYLTVFLMFNGSAVVTVGEKEYWLNQDDLLVINPRQQYQVKSTSDNLLLSLRIAKKPITPQFKENWLPFIECSTNGSETENAEKFQQLRVALAHLMAAYFKQNDETEIETYQHFFTVLTLLVKNFKKEYLPVPTITENLADERMSQLLEQIQKNYSQPISLESLAEMSGISYYYLSRSFKKQVGVNFTEYLNQIRLMHASEALVSTSQSVLKVAFNSGFSNAKNFYDIFKKQYGLTPANYRKKYSLAKNPEKQQTKDDDFQEITGAAALQELARYLVEKDIEDENAGIEQRLQLVLPKESQQNYRCIKKIIKIGPAGEGLANSVQRELCILQKDLRFDLIQFEGFCEETNFENDVFLVSEYILNNQWFDFLVSIQLKPMIQLYLPEHYTENADVQLWCDKQLKIIRHFLNRYGRDEVGQWYIQWSLPKGTSIWNESSRWGYRYFYRKLKQLVSECKVGLMSIRSLDEKEYQQYQIFIQEQGSKRCLPDFISFHADPYASTTIKDQHALRFKDYQQKILHRVKSVIEKSQAEQETNYSEWMPELFLTDWNTLVGEGNTFSGTFFRSALILESIVELSKEVRGIAFWLNIKVKERQTHTREDSSLSVFLYEELRRPLFFSLFFLNHLKGELVASGNGYLLTRNQGQYQLLLYNSSYLDPLYSVDTFQVQYQTKKMKIHLKGLPIGNYLIREYVLDKDHGGIYNDWIRIGGQAELDYELQKYLEQKIAPKFELKKEQIDLFGYELEATLTLNACQLYLFQPLY